MEVWIQIIPALICTDIEVCLQCFLSVVWMKPLKFDKGLQIVLASARKHTVTMVLTNIYEYNYWKVNCSNKVYDNIITINLSYMRVATFFSYVILMQYLLWRGFICVSLVCTWIHVLLIILFVFIKTNILWRGLMKRLANICKRKMGGLLFVWPVILSLFVTDGIFICHQSIINMSASRINSITFL